MAPSRADVATGAARALHNAVVIPTARASVTWRRMVTRTCTVGLDQRDTRLYAAYAVSDLTCEATVRVR